MVETFVILTLWETDGELEHWKISHTQVDKQISIDKEKLYEVRVIWERKILLDHYFKKRNSKNICGLTGMYKKRVIFWRVNPLPFLKKTFDSHPHSPLCSMRLASCIQQIYPFIQTTPTICLIFRNGPRGTTFALFFNDICLHKFGKRWYPVIPPFILEEGKDTTNV